jgi:putative two-component system response regulator
MRVGALVQALARKSGEPPLKALEYGMAAEVHDLGMLSVPEGIAARWTRHRADAKAAFLKHTNASADILRGDHPRFLLAREMAVYHHARWDGSGHPQRVEGRHIPVGARMCAIADAYDDLVSGLGGRKPVRVRHALEKLARGAGARFDPVLVRRFSSIVEDEARGRGFEAELGSGMHGFQNLVTALQEDRRVL